MNKMNDPREILKVVKLMSPQTLPRLEYISREDLSQTNVREGGVREDAPLTADMRYPQPAFQLLPFFTCAITATGPPPAGP